MKAQINIFDCLIHGEIDNVKAAIGAGADVNVANQSATAPLIWAVKSGRVDIVQFLLISGADVNRVFVTGYAPTALIAAAEIGSIEIVELLLQFGADPNVLPRNGFTAMSTALVHRNYDVLLLLLEHGADINLLFDKTLEPFLLEFGNHLSSFATNLTPENADTWKKLRLKSLFASEST